MMHDKFKNLLSNYSIDPKFIEPLKTLLSYTFENLTEQKTSEKKSLSAKLKKVEDDFYNLRKRHAFGEVQIDVYKQFSNELTEQKEAILQEIEKLNENLSNPKHLIKFACDLSCNLSKTWELGDIYQKIQFQNMLFPEGLAYDAQNNDYRTPTINTVISNIADLSKALEHKKSRNFGKTNQNSGFVPGAGVEPARFPTGV